MAAKNKPQKAYPIRIALSDREGFTIVDAEEIYYLSAAGRCTELQMKSGAKHMTSQNLGHYEEILNPEMFLRVHNSHIINFKFCQKYVRTDGGYVLMENKKQIPVSRNRKPLLLKMCHEMS